ncbi:MAG: chemotaxis protein CheW [Planctomycetota bacterium]|nr:MAG: chemotaxis protein CheW [Planctomycetota bacterium]
MTEQVIETKGEVIQLVNFRLRDEEFGVEISSVKEIIRVGEIAHIPDAPSSVRGMTNLRGQIIAVVDLAEKFGLSQQPDIPQSARIMVTEVKNQIVGILVDEVSEVFKIPAENIESTPEVVQTKDSEDYIQGVGNLDNRIIILLDFEKLLAVHKIEELAPMSMSAAKLKEQTNG